MDAGPNPRYVSHMQPIFTEQWKREQEIRAKQHEVNSSRLENINKAKHTVVVFAWVQDDSEPVIVEYQDGFTWPHFLVSRPIIDDLGFENHTTSLKLFRPSFGRWSRIQENHVVSVDSNNHVFLKGTDVTRCLEFDEHLKQSTQQHVLPFHRNLPAERAAVRRESRDVRHKAEPVNATTKRKHKCPPSPPNNSDTVVILSSPEPISAGNAKRQRQRSTVQVLEISSDSDPGTLVWQHAPHSPPVKVKIEPGLTPKRICHSDSTSTCSSSDASRRKSVWPRDYYVRDIVECFVACGDKEGSKPDDQRVAAIFKSFFDAPFKRSTFYENQMRWQLAPQSIKDTSSDVSWSTFLTMIPSRRASRRGASVGKGKAKARSVSVSSESSQVSSD